ncbi:MAG: GAD-like domain-containing protein [Rhodococcus sp. (in: high G+C Gram-positive bacteria)]|uniref:GAD-like domain-containing protein n=1 Tax=Rhodococcus sp. TaxID=1831 RepID=UPI002ADD08B8|nr:GAD-like domain-containing protein [Rhodococcus sp. (in: high G+C Gram-positive bacteria)]
MRGEHFAEFIREFGEATHRVEVPTDALERWRGRLPEQLMTYWREEGWSGYANGLFWTVNPGDYEDLIGEWLAGTPLEKLDTFHVIARTAFGKLYVCGEKVGPVVKVACLIHGVFGLAKELRVRTAEELDFKIRGFFGATMKDECDFTDANKKPLFDRAMKKLGPLAPDEMYALEPAMVLGGKPTLENLTRVKLDPHLTLLRQLAAPTMPYADVDIDKLIKT